MRQRLHGKNPGVRRLLCLLFVGSTLVLTGACDDAPEDPTQIDEDDNRLGPGDGNDETGPGR